MAIVFPKVLLKIRVWVVLIIVSLLIFYVAFNYKQPNTSYVPLSRAEFKWLPVQNVTSLDVCRNSQQGSTLAVDELGYVCTLQGVCSSGCCSTEENSHSRRFMCNGCVGVEGCCAIYEHCVSCCLHPDKQGVLEVILARYTQSFHPLYSSVSDQFELCLSICRTSSQSVRHENAYRNPSAKYCYGLEMT